MDHQLPVVEYMLTDVIESSHTDSAQRALGVEACGRGQQTPYCGTPAALANCLIGHAAKIVADNGDRSRLIQGALGELLSVGSYCRHISSATLAGEGQS